MNESSDNQDLRALFGRNLRSLRLREKLSQRSLAERVGLTSSQVSKIEEGVSGPSFGTIQKLARLLDCEPSTFFLNEPEIESQPHSGRVMELAKESSKMAQAARDEVREVRKKIDEISNVHSLLGKNHLNRDLLELLLQTDDKVQSYLLVFLESYLGISSDAKFDGMINRLANLTKNMPRVEKN